MERLGGPGDRRSGLLALLARRAIDENATEAEAKYRFKQCGGEHGAW